MASGYLSTVYRQTKALLWKNALLSWRNKLSTFLQLFSSFFFIFLIFAVDRAVQASLRSHTYFKNLQDPEVTPIPAIPPCEDQIYIKSPCYDFVWSGNGSETVVSLVQNISTNNPGRPIDFATQTLGFSSPAAVDTWLLANPYRTVGAVHFMPTTTSSSSSTMGYGIQTNTTAKSRRGEFEDITFQTMVPLQMAAERELARYLAQDWSLSWTPAYSEFAHPALGTLSIVGQSGPTFLFAATMFAFVIQMSNLVVEKEMKLRQAMSTMGLLDSAFWLSWLLWEGVLTVVSSLLLVLFGMIFQFDFFLHNSFVVLFLNFYLFQMSMVSVAFMASAFLKRSSSANSIGFVIFIIGFITQLVVTFGFPYDKQFSKGMQVIVSLFPPDLFSLSLKYLGDATSTPQDPGIKIGGVGKCPFNNEDCVITMGGIWAWFLSLFVLYFLLALYFDNVFPDVNGIRKPALFFLHKSFWTGEAGIGHHRTGCCSSSSSSLPSTSPSDTPPDADVAAEEEKVRLKEKEEGVEEGEGAPAVSVRGLHKLFPGTRELQCCCRLKTTPAFHAVKGSWFEIPRDQLFCLLGPNGAGKSTTINCLTGILPVTEGDALIYGKPITSPASMAQIRSIMGVCPQFDILWESLTGQEHLELFGLIKGVPQLQVKKTALSLLQEVSLLPSASQRAGSYSGGMKRRLSVAIALIGDPQIVFLDEPTTGMDPVTRRLVWDLIQRLKRDRAVVLTTHSMEEADVLGDRIAIMARGRLRCLGSTIHLKNKFGAGFNVTVGVGMADGREEEGAEAEAEDAADGTATIRRVQDYFHERLGDIPSEVLGEQFVKFVVPKHKELQLKDLFLDLRSRQSSLGISSLHLSLTTLEEVFLRIAAEAEMEAAVAEGRTEVIALPDGTELEVPLGAPSAIIPNSESEDAPQGMTLDIHWQQDDQGRLHFSHVSHMRPMAY